MDQRQQLHQPGGGYVAFQLGQAGGTHGQRLLTMTMHQQPAQRTDQRLMADKQHLGTSALVERCV